MRFFCTSCAKSIGDAYKPFCDCGGMVEVAYEPRSVHLADSPNPYIRFADLLPVASTRDRFPADARYSPTLHARKLGAYLDMPSLYLKDETVLPTRSTKDRMAAVSLGFLWERGVRAFCTSSTGNSSTSYAYAIRAFPGMTLYLFTAENFVTRVQHADHPQVVHFGMRDATFVEAFNYAATYAAENKLVSERGFFNLGRREGLKMAFFEVADQVPGPIDWYVQAVSSAMGVYGTYKGAKELHAVGHIDRLPKLLCAQQTSCAPMVRAFEDRSSAILPHHVVARPAGIAEAILRGDPTRVYPYVKGIVVESGGDFVAVTEDEIREARRLTEELEGISPCFSASTAVAGLIRKVRNGTFPRTESVMVNLTGGDRPRTLPATSVRWLRRNGSGWVEEA
ncbi:MAG TPA: pyridoxal-phosphate dependent enzyme [Casimicrobiaceae bacterium]|nr:pyridoxal-phosphate dependent enzyme [Casimicrobiaceae bacterium]